MRTVQEITNLRHPTTADRPVYSPLEAYWKAFQEWRKRRRLQTELCRLTDSELMDIGITRIEIDCVAPNRGIVTPHRSAGWHNSGALIYLMLCNACILVLASEAKAQCTARDVLQNQLRSNKIPSPAIPQVLVKSAVGVPAWKKISVGTFANSFALRNALSAKGCAVGSSAREILARPAFTLSASKTVVELFAVSAAELGFETETASLGQIYARAQQLGFELAAAEIAPQLRLQYLDQPVGEFLIIGMEPIKTWQAEPVILTVANGGAGLILIGQDGRLDAQIATTSRFLFVQPNKAAPAEAALVDR
ncbi:uncharacterized protein YjiS (DUF1127 family) [Bradyrhizobium sp. AZCC 1678]|uniref:DUF1127 domain-containing protein n=1 Tax=Bradyrhizobium sp. AZCC 1678 TaxID=3117030 RepID=UPI002FF0211A